MFRFRFEVLLTQRRHAEECLQKELSGAQRALAAERDALRDMKTTRRRCARDLKHQQDAGLRVADLLLYASYLERLEHDIQAQLKLIAAAVRRENQARLALIEAMKKRRILEELKAKALARHRHTLEERERKFIDEIACRRHPRPGDPALIRPSDPVPAHGSGFTVTSGKTCPLKGNSCRSGFDRRQPS